MKEETYLIFLAAVVDVFSVIGASIIWILFKDEFASIFTLVSCIIISMIISFMIMEEK